jgi:hypothetical protein
MAALANQDMAALSRALSVHLPPLGVAAFSISRLSTASSREPRLQILARLSPDFISAKGAPLPISSLGIDQTLQHRAAVVLMPLEFNHRPVGIAGLAWGAHNLMTYELLREWLSVAVYASDSQNERPRAPALREGTTQSEP